MRPTRLVGLSLAVVCAAQSCRFPAETIDCDSEDDCTAERGGQCEADGRCSYPDGACGSRRRYGVHSTGHGQCVPTVEAGAGGTTGDAAMDGTTSGGQSGGKPVPRAGGAPGTLPDGGEERDALVLIAGAIGGEGTIDGRGALSRFVTPNGLAYDGERYLYLADSSAHTLRRIDTRTANVTTLAGYPIAWGFADGPVESARFDGPESVTFDGSTPDQPVLFVTEWSGHRLRKIDLNEGKVTTVAGSLEGTAGLVDGTGVDARFNLPEDTARGDGNVLYVADGQNHVIRSVDLATGAVLTIAGSYPTVEAGATDGPAATARFQHPYGLAFDATGKRLFISEFMGDRVRVLDLATATVSTVVSTGLASPASMRFDGANGRLVVTSFFGNGVVSLDVAQKTVTPLVLRAGPGFEPDPDLGAGFANPNGIAEVNGGYFVSDFGASTIRRLVPAPGGAYETTHFAGLAPHAGREDGSGAEARFAEPGAAIFVDESKTLCVVDESNDVIRSVNVVTGEVATYAGDGTHGSQDGTRKTAHFHAPRAITAGKAPVLYVSEERGAIRKIDPVADQVTTLFAGDDAILGFDALVATPSILYATETDANVIVQMPIGGGPPETLVGVRGTAGCEDGPFALARFGEPSGILWDGASALLVADGDCKTIRRLDLTAKTVQTVAGGGTAETYDGKGAAARFVRPLHLSWAAGHTAFYVGDEHVVRRVELPTFQVTTFAGSREDFGGVRLPPSPPRLNRPNGLVEGAAGELYITSENALLRYSPD